MKLIRGIVWDGEAKPRYFMFVGTKPDNGKTFRQRLDEDRAYARDFTDPLAAHINITALRLRQVEEYDTDTGKAVSISPDEWTYEEAGLEPEQANG